MYVTELLAEPDRDVWLIDWGLWDCLVCDETGGYDFEMEEQDLFRLHVDVFRDMARHAADPDQVAWRERRQIEFERELGIDDA